MEEILVGFAIKYNGDWEKIKEAIERKEKPYEYDKNEVSCSWITILSKDYPNELKYIHKPPFVLFYKGNIELLKTKRIAVIGSRKASKYGMKTCKNLVTDLVNNRYTIVSGLAEGIDSCSHQTCLENKGKTIAILGYGIDYKNEQLYQEIEKEGLILSEYPFNTFPTKESFLFRNRLISALSKAVLVIEAKYKSGTMNTISHALNQNRDIFCVPTRIDENSGCNKMIKEGAKLVENINDILDEI